MSETDNNTSAIDDKKKEDSSSDDISIEEYLKKGLSFLVYIVIYILLILGVFMNGSILLFLGKLAQTNILPTDKDCSPYTEQPAKFEGDINKPVKMDMYSTMDKSNPDVDPIKVSMKISFENDNYNASNSLMDAMRKYKNASSSNFLINYFISIMDGLLQSDYSLLNSYMNLTNKYFSETMIMLFSPILFIILFVCLFINDFLHLVYLWFSKMSWFFKTNTNDTGSGSPKWENVSLMSPFNWFIGFCFVCIFFILFFVVLFIGSPLILGRVLYVILSSLFYKAILYNANGNNETVNGISLVLETFKQYKLAIVWIISVIIIISAFSHIGIIPGLLCLLVVCLLYFKVIPTDIFDPIKLNQYTKYNGDFKQNTKTCQPIRETTTKTDNSFLYNLFIGYLLNLFGLTKTKQQGGKKHNYEKKNKHNKGINASLKKIYKLSNAKNNN
jgi:hypothetical protein